VVGVAGVMPHVSTSLYADTIALRSEMPCVSSRDRPWAAPCSDAGPVAVCPVAAGPGAAARAEVEAVLPAPAGPAGERTRNVATMAPAATAPATIPAAAINRRRASRGGPPGPPGPGPPGPGPPGPGPPAPGAERLARLCLQAASRAEIHGWGPTLDDGGIPPSGTLFPDGGIITNV